MFFLFLRFEIDEEPANPLFFRVSASTLPRGAKMSRGSFFTFVRTKGSPIVYMSPPFTRLALFAVHDQLLLLPPYVFVTRVGWSYMRLRPRTNRLAIPRMYNVLSVDAPASVRYTIIFKFLRAWWCIGRFSPSCQDRKIGRHIPMNFTHTTTHVVFWRD